MPIRNAPISTAVAARRGPSVRPMSSAVASIAGSLHHAFWRGGGGGGGLRCTRTMMSTATSATNRKMPPTISAATIGPYSRSSHMNSAAQKKPSATAAATSATTPPAVDFTAMSILCLTLAIGPSNTAPCPRGRSTAPGGAEQETEPDRQRDGRQRMLLHRVLQRLAEMVGYLAQRLTAALARIRHGLVETILHAAHAALEVGDRLAAGRAQEIAHLPGEPGEVVTQGLHVALDVLDGRGCIFGGRHSPTPEITRHRSTRARMKSSITVSAWMAAIIPAARPPRRRTGGG